MPKNKGPEWDHVTVVADGGKGTSYFTMQCLYCDKVYSGGVNRVRTHLAGGDTSISKCDNAPDEVVDKMNSLSKEKTQRGHEKKRKRSWTRFRGARKQICLALENMPVSQKSILLHSMPVQKQQQCVSGGNVLRKWNVI